VDASASSLHPPPPPTPPKVLRLYPSTGLADADAVVSEYIRGMASLAFACLERPPAALRPETAPDSKNSSAATISSNNSLAADLLSKNSPAAALGFSKSPVAALSSTKSLYSAPAPLRCLHLGVGGGVLARLIALHAPESEHVAVEIDGAVVSALREACGGLQLGNTGGLCGEPGPGDDYGGGVMLDIHTPRVLEIHTADALQWVAEAASLPVESGDLPANVRRLAGVARESPANSAPPPACTSELSAHGVAPLAHPGACEAAKEGARPGTRLTAEGTRPGTHSGTRPTAAWTRPGTGPVFDVCFIDIFDNSNACPPAFHSESFLSHLRALLNPDTGVVIHNLHFGSSALAPALAAAERGYANLFMDVARVDALDSRPWAGNALLCATVRAGGLSRLEEQADRARERRGLPFDVRARVRGARSRTR
jgi:hypothetical protein